MRSGLRVLYAEADERLGAIVQAAPTEKRRHLKPIIDADLS